MHHFMHHALLLHRLVYILCFVAMAAQAATRTWNGSVSGYWTNLANWSGGVAPTNGDAVIFPDSATRKTVTNTVNLLTLGSVTFSGSNYVLQGLGSGVQSHRHDQSGFAGARNKSGAAPHVVSLAARPSRNTVGGSVLELKTHLPVGSSTNLLNIAFGSTFKGAGDLIVNHLRLIDDPTQTLTKEGSGTMTFRGTAAGHTGGFDVKAGRMRLESAVFDFTTFNVFSNATLSGNGQVATVFMNLGGTLEASDSQAAALEIINEVGLAGKFRTVLSGFTPQSGFGQGDGRGEHWHGNLVAGAC